ncbi:hypothetical protein ACFL14_02180 [Patescibacteria group bacterium]
MKRFFKHPWIIQILKYSIIIACGFGVYTSQLGFDDIWDSEAYKRRLTTTVLPVKATQRISVGMDNVLADMYWLQAIQYLGVGASQGGHPALATMLENTTTLDPDFEYPYIFSSLILPGEGHLEKAQEIADQGIEKVPDSWQIPYYAGLSIYQIQLNDYTKASELVKLASTKKDAPENLPYIANILLSRTNEKVKAYYSWKVIAESAENKYSRERAQTFIEHYEIIFYLEKLNKTYREQYGAFPNTLQDLVKVGYIKEIPSDSLERGFIYKKETGEVFTNNFRRFGPQE